MIDSLKIKHRNHCKNYRRRQCMNNQCILIDVKLRPIPIVAPHRPHPMRACPITVIIFFITNFV